MIAEVFATAGGRQSAAIMKNTRIAGAVRNPAAQARKRARGMTAAGYQQISLGHENRHPGGSASARILVPANQLGSHRNRPARP